MIRFKLYAYGKLETLLATMGRKLEGASQTFALCPDCGKNRYTARPCVNVGTEKH